MPNARLVRWLLRALAWSGLGLGLTGLGQMPIFSRYYVADVPGLGWLGDFRITAQLHLLLGAVFLFLLGMLAVTWLSRRRFWSALGWLRACLLAAVAVSGFVRVLQNGLLPLFGPATVRYLDWSHLGLAVALGLAFCLPGRRPHPAPLP